MPIPRGLAFLSLVAALMLFAPRGARAQDSVVAGTVVAARSLQPLEGVELRVVSTDIRTRTDARGRFLLQHLTGRAVTLELRWLGYRPLTETVRVGDRGIRLVLREVAIELDAIVVTGTAGETQARAIGNAVSQLNAADVLRDVPVADVQQLVGGRIPGVSIEPMQGMVGGGGLTRVRGIASLFLPNEPLIYIDGARVDNNPRAGPDIRLGRQVSRINDLHPEDIEYVEVIKGPAAGTLYGTEASRGVIQIFTRRGTPGPARFAHTLKQGANWFMNPAERVSPVFCCQDPVTGALDSVNLIEQETVAGRPIFSTGRPWAYGASVSGGSETVRYYVSGNLDRDEGMVSYNWRNRLSARANLSILSSDKIDIETRFGFLRNRIRLAQAGGTALWDIMSQIHLGTPTTRDSATRGFDTHTPQEIATIDSRSYTDRTTASVQVNHHPWSWFSHRLTLGSDIGDEIGSVFYPSDPTGPFSGLSDGDLTVERSHVAVSSLDYSASVSAALTAALRSVTSVGAQLYDRRLDYVRVHGSNFPPGHSTVGGAASTDGAQDVVQIRGAGVFAQQQFAWKNRVFLTAALRGDDNSVFGPTFDLVTYPKISATWVVNEEPFWRGPLSALNTLKLRAAWGRAGQQPDAFAAVRSYQPVPGPGDTSVVTPLSFGNPNLRPERGEELEAGFDAGMFADRAAISFTYYHQRIRDAIVPRLIPSNGFREPEFLNLGEVTNHGLELSLDARIVDRPSVAWDLGLAYGTNANRVVSLGGLGSIYVRTAIRASTNQSIGQWNREGYPLGAYFVPLVVSARFDASGNVVDIMCASGPEAGAPPATCDNSERQRLYAGRPTPAWVGSVRSTITLFGNLRLSGLIDFRGGNKLWYQTASFAAGQENTRAVNERTDAIFLAYDQLALGDDPIMDAGVRRYLIDGGFAKLREVSLSYTLPGAITSRLGGSSATLTVAGRNLAILWQAQKEVYSVKVLDPETRGSVDQAAGIFNTLPQYAQFMTALRVSF